MSVVDGGSASGLIQRVQDILLRPKPTWDVIDGEPATIKGLYTGYICILAAIGPICGFISTSLFSGAGFAVFGLVAALVGYGLSLLSVYLVALVIDGLAPSFDGTKNQIQAFKTIAYAQTAAWVGGIFNLIPIIGWLGAIAAGIYSIYLLYLGLPKLMKSPQDKAVVYTLVVVVISIVISFVISMVIGMIAVMGMAGGAIASGGFH